MSANSAYRARNRDPHGALRVRAPSSVALARWHAGALALYLALAAVLIDHGQSPLRGIAGQGEDPMIFIWFFAWWPWAVAHHLPLLHTNLLWQPVGVATLWVTSVPLLSLLALPLTLSAGPVFAYNVFAILDPVLAAYAAYFLCLSWAEDAPAAMIGGFLFGFSAYELGQDFSNINLSCSALVPLLAWVASMHLQGRLARRISVLMAAVLLVAQFLVSLEVFAMVCVFGALAWLLAVLSLPDRRRLLLGFGLSAAAALALAVAALAPLLISLIQTRHSLHLPDIWRYFFEADLANIVIPSARSLFGAPFLPISQRFHGSVQEQGAYLGWPLLLILALYARRFSRQPERRLLLLVFLVLLTASLGAFLTIGGFFTGIALPWYALAQLPLLRDALPIRFTLFTALAAALMAALWIGAPGRRRAKLTLGVLACLALLPHPQPWQRLPDLAAFQPGRLQAALGPSPRLLILPFALHGPEMDWQVENHFGFTMAGGYLGFPPAQMQRDPAEQALFGDVVTPRLPADFAAFCRRTGTQFVVLAPGVDPATRAAIGKLHWPAQRIDEVTVLTVPPA